MRMQQSIVRLFHALSAVLLVLISLPFFPLPLFLFFSLPLPLFYVFHVPLSPISMCTLASGTEGWVRVCVHARVCVLGLRAYASACACVLCLHVHLRVYESVESIAGSVCASVYLYAHVLCVCLYACMHVYCVCVRGCSSLYACVHASCVFVCMCICPRV